MAQDTVKFYKMNGIGNEIIDPDMRSHGERIASAAANNLAANEYTRFDQLMAVHAPRSAGYDAFIHILNSDGSEAGACGNGTRCVVSWLHNDGGKREFVFETSGGRLEASLTEDELISVNMGVPQFDWDQIPLAEEFADTRSIELQIGPIDDPVLHTPSVASIGNPHAVFWVKDDLQNYDLDRFGPLLENHPIFPDRANITIARVLSKNRVAIRTWERGAGITRACGSAACATVVNGVRTGRLDRKATVLLPGGDLDIHWRDDGCVIMTGPVEYEFSGMMNPLTGTWTRNDKHESS
jgi:diaminopimelate epimerase